MCNTEAGNRKCPISVLKSADDFGSPWLRLAVGVQAHVQINPAQRIIRRRRIPTPPKSLVAGGVRRKLLRTRSTSPGCRSLPFGRPACKGPWWGDYFFSGSTRHRHHWFLAVSSAGKSGVSVIGDAPPAARTPHPRMQFGSGGSFVYA